MAIYKDTPKRAEPGRKNIRISKPDGVPEYPIRPKACQTCQYSENHDVCQTIGYGMPYGKKRNEHIPNESRITGDKIFKTQQRLFAEYESIYSKPTWTPYNAGMGATANNATVQVRYQLIEASGSILTIRGPNTKRIQLSESILNPDFVAPNLGEPRLTSRGFAQELPAGATVVFLPNSVLYNKVRPIIKRIYPPASNNYEDDVTFQIEVSCDCTVAKTPVYEWLKTRKFWVDIHWEGVFKPKWLDAQSRKETQWTIKTKTFDVPNEVLLPDSLDNPCRVLYPNMPNLDSSQLPDGNLVVMLNKNGTSNKLFDEFVISRLNTTQTPSGWSTTLDLTGLDFDTVDVTYCPTATSEDTFLKYQVSSCKHAKVDPSGSYEHKDGARCSNVDDAQEALDNFEAECWQPSTCAGFDLGCGEKLLDDQDFFSSLYSRNNWHLVQGVAGISNSRNFSLIRPAGGGPSIQGILGGYKNEVSIEADTPYKEEWQQPVKGQLVTFGDRMEVMRGAFYREGKDLTGLGGSNLIPTTNGPARGLLDYSNFFPKKDNSTPYIGETSVTSWQHTGAHLKHLVVKESATESFIIGYDYNNTETNIDEDVKTYIEGIINGYQ